MARGQFSASNYFAATTVPATDEYVAIGAWLYLVNSGSSVFTAAHLHKNNNSGDGFYLALNTATGGKYCRATKRAGGSGSADTSTSVTLNTWHYCLAEYISNTSRQSFVDNAGNVSDTTSISDPTSLSTVFVGLRDWTTNDQPFLGYIAEVSVWAGTSLTSQQKADLASGQAAWTIGNDPVRHWRLLGDDSPEPEHFGGTSLTMNGTVSQQTHPVITIPASVSRGGAALHGAFGGLSGAM